MILQLYSYHKSQLNNFLDIVVSCQCQPVRISRAKLCIWQYYVGNRNWFQVLFILLTAVWAWLCKMIGKSLRVIFNCFILLLDNDNILKYCFKCYTTFNLIKADPVNVVLPYEWSKILLFAIFSIQCDW